MCTTLSGFGECGFGECENETCVCGPGFEFKNELFFKDYDPSITPYCNYNSTIVLVVASILLVFTIITLLLQLYVIENSRQLRRILPIVVGYPFLIVAMIMRIAMIEEPLFPQNAIYTFLIMNAILGANISYIIYLSKSSNFSFVLYSFASPREIFKLYSSCLYPRQIDQGSRIHI